MFTQSWSWGYLISQAFLWRLIAIATSKTQNFTKTIELLRKLKFFGINVNENAKEQAEKFKSLKMVKDEGLMMKDEGYKLFEGFCILTDKQLEIWEWRVAFATQKRTI